MFDIPQMAKAMDGVTMEVQDCAFPIVTSMLATTDYKTAFQDCDIAILIGAKPRGPGMVRADLLKANAGIFKGQGKALDQYASRDVKVLVVGNPANTNALIASTFAPGIAKSNFTALTRLDQNRAKGMIANRTGVNVDDVKNLIIWGNHSKTQYPDITHAEIKATSVEAAVNDTAWLRGDFIKKVQYRGAAVIKARGKSSAASAANAAVDHMRDWVLGTPADGSVVSMAVMSDGAYGVPKDIIFSFPVRCKDGKYTIVRDLKLDDFSREKIRLTTDELLKEKAAALSA